MHSKGLKQIRASSKGGASTFRSCLITLFCNISTQQWKSAVVTELNTTVRNVRLYNNQRPAAGSLQRFLYISRTKRHFCRIGLAEHKCTIWTGSSNYPNPRHSSSFCRLVFLKLMMFPQKVSSPANPLAAAVDCFSCFRRNPFGLSAQCSWQIHALLESDAQSSFFSSLSGRGPDLVWIQSPPHTSHIFSTLLISVFTAVKMDSFLFYCCTFPSIGSNPFVILHSDHEYIVQMQPFSHAL